MNKSDTIVKIVGALLRAQSKMGNAAKDAKNPFFKSKYADLNSVREVAHPALNSEGVLILQPTINVDGKNFVETTLAHESGEWVSSLTEIICAKQNDPQAYGSAISYSRRYGLQSFLSIGAEDSDAEGAMNRTPVTKSSTVTSQWQQRSDNATGTITATAAIAEPLVVKSNGSFKKPQATPVTSDTAGWD